MIEGRFLLHLPPSFDKPHPIEFLDLIHSAEFVAATPSPTLYDKPHPERFVVNYS